VAQELEEDSGGGQDTYQCPVPYPRTEGLERAVGFVRSTTTESMDRAGAPALRGRHEAVAQELEEDSGGGQNAYQCPVPHPRTEGLERAVGFARWPKKWKGGSGACQDAQRSPVPNAGIASYVPVVAYPQM
jgi:hypothetical protein